MNGTSTDSPNLVTQVLSLIPSISPHYYTVALLFLAPIPMGILSKYITSYNARLFFIIITSFVFQFICFQFYVFHTTFAIFVTWLLIKYVPFPYAHYINLVFNFAYITYGHLWRLINFYLVYSTDWTILQMLIVVRLTSTSWYKLLSFRPREQVKAHVIPDIIEGDVGLLELYAYCWHLPGMLIGPGPEFKTFLSFLDLSMFPDRKPPSTVFTRAFITRCIELVIIYMLGVTEPLDFLPMTTPEFGALPIWKRYRYLLIAHYTNMQKYLFMFIAGEVACIGCGISWYVNEDGKEKFCKYRNIRLVQILTARGLHMFADNWNLKCMRWVTTVINDFVPRSWSTTLRHATTYTINAFWHGLYPGYIIFFFFIGIPYELTSKRFLKVVNTYIHPKNPFYRVLQVLGFLFSLWFMQFAHMAFNLMGFELIMKCWTNFHFYMYWCMLLMLIGGYVIPPLPASYWDDDHKEKSKKD